MSCQQALKGFKDGSRNAVDLVEDTLTSIDRCQRELNAFATIASGQALSDARASDKRYRQRKSRPLEGLPIAVKDIVDTKGIETRYGSPAFLEHVPIQDAEIVRRLRNAGAVIVGKTTTHEFAWGVTTSSSAFGNTLHPQQKLRIPGGSSGGGAAAVAYGAVPASIGTDTGGSVRIPAALCGTVGFKPTFNLLPSHGIFPLAPSLDHPGIVARSVEDAMLVADALGIGADRVDRHLTAAVIRTIAPVPLEQGVADAVDAALAALSKELDLSEPDTKGVFDGAFEAFSTIVLTEAGIVHFSRNSQAIIDARYGAETVERLRQARKVTIDAYALAQSNRRALTCRLERLLEDFDFLLLATCPCTAPFVGQEDVEIGHWKGSIREALMTYTAPFNLSGLPAISIPIPLQDGMPVGLQIVARRGRDASLLRFARHASDILALV
ncbi:amidase (plasmid) [Rhizobium sp. WYJ-E13]|nr:amidase [Rhizobium sp. WYJ-E13]